MVHDQVCSDHERVMSPMYSDNGSIVYDEAGNPLRRMRQPQVRAQIPRPTGPVLNFADMLPPPPEHPPPTDIDSPPDTPPRINSPTGAAKGPRGAGDYSKYILCMCTVFYT